MKSKKQFIIALSLVFLYALFLFWVKGQYDQIKEIMNSQAVYPFPVARSLPMRDAVLNLASSKGVDRRVALQVAKCESHFNPLAANRNSTAKGLYQFLDSTFARHCSGEVLNWRDNASCFANNFNQHRSWWEQCI